MGPLLLALLLLPYAPALPTLASGDPPWPDFRGPTRDGHAPDADVPLEWSEEHNVLWRTAIHGRGWSSPVVGEGRAWLTTATPDGSELYVVSVDVDSGEVLLDHKLFEVDRPQHRNALNSYASPSAVLEPGRVYVHFGAEGTAALDTRTHAVLWTRRDLRCDHMEGPGSSPLLVGERLVVHLDGGDVQYVVALDTRTGETLWRTERDVDYSRTPKDLRKAYSTPILVEQDGRPLLVSTCALATFAYDAATGEEVWRVRHPGFSMASRPVAGDGVVYLTTGFMRAELWAVRLGGEGDVTKTHVLWRAKRNIPTMPSPVLVGPQLFVASDSGQVSCLDVESGEALWRERLQGECCASPVLAAGRLYFFDRTGKTTVIAPDEELRVLAENRLEGGFMASPAVVGDAFLLRTETHLYRVEQLEQATGR